MPFIDTHCHLTHGRFHDDISEVVASCQDVGVEKMITIGTGLEDGALGADLVTRYPGTLFSACGLDPFSLFDRPQSFAEDLAALREHLISHNCVALGEIGLEYFHKVLPPDIQQERFHAQLELAQELSLPVVIHVRDAHEDMKAILHEHPSVSGVIHSFDGTAKDAEDYLSLGWMLSFNGMLTFKPKDYLREACQVAPDDRILIETDSPFLAPVPMRGKRCDPSMVIHTAQMLADKRGQDLETIERLTTDNAQKLFGI